MSNQLDLADRLDVHADAYTFAQALDPKERGLIDDLRLASERLRMLDELMQCVVTLARRVHERADAATTHDNFDKIIEQMSEIRK